MARADLLKKLFRSYKAGDSESFMEAALAIVDEERQKHHSVLAKDLAKILMNGRSSPPSVQRNGFEPVPKDVDRHTPLIDVRQPDRYLRELVLREETRTTLESVIREFTHWDVLEANGLVPGHKLLFCGPPGCGKTASAEALATELGLPLLYVRFDSVVSSLLGETSANLRKVFDYAGKDTWVVLFDEFDAIGRSRDDETEHGELKRVVNSFLQLLDQFRGKSLIIAATNFEQSLDPALWRRFDEVARFELPAPHEVYQLMVMRLGKRNVPQSTLVEAVELLAGSSHADVDRVCLDSLKWAVMHGKKGVSHDAVQMALNKHVRRKQALAATRKGTPIIDER